MLKANQTKIPLKYNTIKTANIPMHHSMTIIPQQNTN